MHLILKSILQGCGWFALLALTAWLAIYGINFTSRRKAESLLQDIRTLRVEESTADQVREVMMRHGGSASSSYASFCQPSDGAYAVWTGSMAVYRVAQALPVLERLGLRPWGTDATVILRAGKVCYVDYRAGMMAPGGDWQWEIDTSLMPPATINRPVSGRSGYRAYTRVIRAIRRLTSELTPEATGEERQRAFHYDFSCLTRFSGCRQRCELAPQVWADVYRNSPSSNGGLPADEIGDPRCKPLEQTQYNNIKWFFVFGPRDRERARLLM